MKRICLTAAALALVAAPAAQADLPQAKVSEGPAIERPLAQQKSILEMDGYHPGADYNGDGGGVYPFCKQVWYPTRWEFYWGAYVYSLLQDVGYCGNGFVTQILWARAAPDSAFSANCYTNWGPVMWHVGGGVGQTSVDYHARAEVGCSYPGIPTLYGVLWVTRRYQGDGYHYTLARA